MGGEERVGPLGHDVQERRAGEVRQEQLLDVLEGEDVLAGHTRRRSPGKAWLTRLDDGKPAAGGIFDLPAGNGPANLLPPVLR